MKLHPTPGIISLQEHDQYIPLKTVYHDIRIGKAPEVDL